MAYVTLSHSSKVSGIFDAVVSAVSVFFTAFGKAMMASSEARLQKAERLNAKSDEELAALGLRREDIPSYVFRDLMHL